VCPHAQIQREGPFRKQRIRCVLIHDHVLLRQGLRRLLEDEPDMEIVAEAGTVAEALQRVAQHRPEVVITDAHMFRCAAEQTEMFILNESPHSKVLFLMMHTEDASASEEISCTVRQTSAEQLVEMVRKAHFGNETVREMPGPSIGERPERLRKRKRVLTTREREVLKLLAEGRTVRSVADFLGLSMKTVDAHKFNLMRKLGLHNKAELVMWAIQKKVLKLPVNF
jgi:two-component system, NarL family, response regulator NreC